MASACALCLPSVASRVFQTEVTNQVSGTHQNEKCTGMILSTSSKGREVEVQSLYSPEVPRMCEIEFALSEESSRARRLRVELGSIFRMRKHT